MNWTSASFNLLDESMVTQACWYWMVIDILSYKFFGLFIPFFFVILSFAISSVSFKVKEVSANWTITIFKSC